MELHDRMRWLSGFVAAFLISASALWGQTPPLGPIVSDQDPDIEGFMWFTVPAETRVSALPYQTRRLAGAQSPCQPIDMAAGRGEYESAQLVFSPGIFRHFDNVSLAFSDLVNAKAKAKLPASEIDWRLVKYVALGDVLEPKFTDWWKEVVAATKLAEIPDVLQPVSSFSTSRDQPRNYPLWITLHVPYGTPPGQYIGTIDLRQNGRTLVTRPLRVRVWDFDIPRDPHIRTGLFNVSTDYPNVYYGFTHQSPAAFRLVTRAWNLVLSHRMEPAAPTMGVPLYDTHDPRYQNDPMAGLLSPAALERFRTCCRFWKSHGRAVNDVNMVGERSWDFTAQGREMKQKVFAAYTKILKETGTADGAYIRQPDEYGSIDEAKKAHEFAKELRSIAPGIKILTTGVQGNAKPVYEAAVGSSDIWCDYPNGFDRLRDFFQARRAKGEDVWWYIHYALFYSSPDASIRRFFWAMQKEHIRGCILWSTTAVGVFTPTPYTLQMHGFKVTPGDGVLFWPDPEHGLIESVRLEQMRDGLEDCEYFWLLDRARDTLEASKQDEDVKLLAEVRGALAAPGRLLASSNAYREAKSVGAETLRDQRDKMGELLDRLNRAGQLPKEK